MFQTPLKFWANKEINFPYHENDSTCFISHQTYVPSNLLKNIETVTKYLGTSIAVHFFPGWFAQLDLGLALKIAQEDLQLLRVSWVEKKTEVITPCWCNDAIAWCRGMKHKSSNTAPDHTFSIQISSRIEYKVCIQKVLGSIPGISS